MEDMKKKKNVSKIWPYISPTFGGDNLLLTNLTGHPSVVVPNGFDEKGRPTSITFIGNFFEEANTLVVAKAYQDATEFHLKHPEMGWSE
jgi:Asp-tRNA(Asn)/Glu-tRNA(Gln) amidotransferase A subunit family amidase